MSKPICQWIKQPGAVLKSDTQWRLIVNRGRTKQVAAVVWFDGTWHTFDESGTGGENSQGKTVERAKIEAAASAIEQGFI